MNAFKYFLLIFMVLAFSISAIAQDEDITLTTYYPAPYGEYDGLIADRMVIGSNYDMTANSGDLIIEGNVGIGTNAPTVPLEVVGNIIAADPTDDDHVATRRYIKNHAMVYNLGDVVTPFIASQETGLVTLVDVTYENGGVLLGGSVSGNFVDSITITVDAGTADVATITFTPPFCEIEHGNDDYRHAGLPSPVTFNKSLKITYNASGSSNLVGGIAYVLKND
jgi:hypothetical protein